MNQNQLVRRYIIEFIVSMAAYVLVLTLSVSVLNRLPSDSAWRIALALAPVAEHFERVTASKL